MSRRSFRSLALLAAGVFAAACQEGSPTAPSLEADLELQASLEVAGADAERSGDPERAEALRHGATALRWGIRPSLIEVKVDNETFRYLALVVGVVHQRPDGGRVLIRSLVAWNGRPTAAILQVTSKSDQAQFGLPAVAINLDVPGLARGHWKDLVNQQLWVATSGSANLELGALGEPCAVQPQDTARRCVKAFFDIRIGGAFQKVESNGPVGSAIEISTEADRVNGVVIKPADE